MSETPIHDQLAEEMNPAAADPGDCEPAADVDPDPVLNEDADDDLADVEDGDDNNDNLDGDDDDEPAP